ncbi:MFS transporter [Microbacterium sp. AGC85]
MAERNPAPVGAPQSVDTSHRRSRFDIIGPKQALGIAAICSLVALVMEIKSLMVVPMTPIFISEAGLSPVAAGWVLLAASLVGLASTGVLARIGDIVGHRKVIIGVLTCQLVGNTITAMAMHPSMVIAGRAIAGVSASVPLLIAIFRDRLEEKDVRRGIGFISGIQGPGVAISFLFAGAFMAVGFSWREVFLLTAGLSTLCLILVIAFVPESRYRERVKIDVVGVLGLCVWPVLLVIAITKSNEWGVFSVPTLACAGTAVLVLAFWVGYERRHPAPILNVKVAFGKRMLPVLLVSASQAGAAFFCYIGVSNYVQIPVEIAGYGFTASLLTAGLVLVPMSIIIGFGSTLAAKFVNVLGGRLVLSFGLLVMGAVFLYWTFNRSSIWDFVIGAAIWACGMCWIWAGQFTIATQEAPMGQTAAVNGAVMMFQAFGGSLGPALVTALITAQLVPGTGYSVEQGWTNTFAVAAVWMGLAFIIALFIPRGVGKVALKAKMTATAGTPETTTKG